MTKSKIKTKEKPASVMLKETEDEIRATLKRLKKLRDLRDLLKGRKR